MTSFEEYLRKRNEMGPVAAEGNVAIRAQEDKEWERLQERLVKITEGKTLGTQEFKWKPYPAPHPNFLQLNNVAVTFEAGTAVGDAPRQYRLVFSRRPLGANEIMLDEPDPLRWWLNLNAVDGVFYWTRKESGLKLTTLQFADDIAMQLLKYHDDFAESLKF